jgi:hypothetical protein
MEVTHLTHCSQAFFVFGVFTLVFEGDSAIVSLSVLPGFSGPKTSQ